MIEIEKGQVHITEQTVKELVAAIKKAKEETPEFISEPMSNDDMDQETFRAGMRKRGTIFVKSEYSGISFKIYLETKPNTQESLDYRLK